MKLTFKVIFITLSTLSILMLLIDTYLSNNYFMEGSVISLLILLFAFNILRLIYSKLNNVTIGFILNLAWFGFTIFNFYFLGLITWGSLFMSGELPIMISLAITINMMVFLTLMFWYGKQLQNLNKD